MMLSIGEQAQKDECNDDHQFEHENCQVYSVVGIFIEIMYQRTLDERAGSENEGDRKRYNVQLNANTTHSYLPWFNNWSRRLIPL